jgi:hypothetical protein
MWARGARGSGIGFKEWPRLATGLIHGSRGTRRLSIGVCGWLGGSRRLGEGVVGIVVRSWGRGCVSIRISGHLCHWSWLSKWVALRVMLAHSGRTGEVVIPRGSRGVRRLRVGVILLTLGEPVRDMRPWSVKGVLSLGRGHGSFKKRD